MPTKNNVAQPCFNLAPVLVAGALLVAGAGLGMTSVFTWIHEAWWSFAGVGVYSHGYIVLGMAIWMAWTGWRYRCFSSTSACCRSGF